MQPSLFFSLLFFTTFTIELFIGLYVLTINPKGKLNRQFFFVVIALCLWSFGFAMGNIAPTIETCLIWRRVAAVGWTTAYSLLLHFILILTGRDSALKKWNYFFLYLPAIVCLFVFSVNKEMAFLQYNLVQVDYGWINIAVNNVWDWFFYIYYIGYVILSIGILYHWKRGSKENRVKKQANIMLISILLIAVLGTVTDLLLSYFVKSPLPQMAPIFNLIPVFAILYSIKKNSYMRELTKNEDNSILNERSRSKLYTYLAILFLIGGVLSSLPLLLPNLIQDPGARSSTLIASISVASIGVLIMVFQLIKNEKLKDILIIGVILLSIPVTTFRFFESAAITIWVFPAILMIVALAFRKKTPLVLIVVISIITQIAVWGNSPTRLVRIDDFDYIMRIGLLAMTFGIALMINIIYVRRLEDNTFQIKFQRLISEVSADLISIDPINLDEKIDDLLYKMGQFFLVDRTYIFLIDQQQKTMTYTHEWCNQEALPRAEAIRDVPVNELSWWMKELTHHKLVNIADVDTLPESATVEKEALAKQGVLSAVVIPIEQDEMMLGFIGLDSVTAKKKWSPYHIDLLRTLSNLIADAFIRIESEKTIEYMAYYDHLTGLPNRTLFAERLSQALHLAKRNESFLGVLFLDLDGFKIVNDTMGHSGGDALLKELSQGLKSCLRKTDTVARFGGDEFLLLINNLEDENSITKVADTVMELFKHPVFVYEHEFYVTASVGVAVYPFDGEDTETLIKNADMAMYMAKKEGKNQYVMCTTNMKEEVKKNIHLSNQLYRVQERNELLLYYQPQVRLSDGKMVGLEALLRWKHPQLGMISPSVFIPLAETNGTINEIGEWVLKTAIYQNKEWQEQGFPPVRMAVNLSAVQLNNPNFVDRVKSILRESGLMSQYLELEITESIAMKESANIVSALNQLKEYGISLSIDDFGTEYSTLSRLKDLPIDRIKIDMQFIRGIESSEKDKAITKVIINLAKTLGLDVLAEGVETVPQLEFLNKKMCDEVQGYYYYKPMSKKEIDNLFRMQMLDRE